MSLNALEAMIDPVNSPLLGPPTRPPRLRAPDLPVGGLFALGWASYPPTPKTASGLVSCRLFRPSHFPAAMRLRVREDFLEWPKLNKAGCGSRSAPARIPSRTR
jgi:hypothetical protein